MTDPSTTYRESHQTKGSDYHSEFARNPRRRLLWNVEQQFLNKILDQHPDRKSLAHLDFACGTGRVLQHVEGHVGSSTGVDISASMLAVARENTSQSTLIEADLTRNDPLSTREFDLITAFRFFPNAEQELRRDAMSALACHLATDGLLVFNNHRSTQSLRRRATRLLTWGRRGISGMSLQEVAELVDSAGLCVEKVYHVGIVPETERLLLRPRILVGAIERLCVHLPLAAWSENLIYVCRRRVQSSASEKRAA
jgi:predicted TPR repeat methyltransferase